MISIVRVEIQTSAVSSLCRPPYLFPLKYSFVFEVLSRKLKIPVTSVVEPSARHQHHTVEMLFQIPVTSVVEPSARHQHHTVEMLFQKMKIPILSI